MQMLKILPVVCVGDNRISAEATTNADTAKSATAGDDMNQVCPARKNRVRYTFPPAAKHM